MTEYIPELGQAIFGNPTGEYEVPCYACSMLNGLLRDWRRVYWNINQEEFENARGMEFRVGPTVYRHYCWDEDSVQAALPNFQLDGDPIEIRWYKHPLRGLSVNKELTPGQWAAWHDKVFRALHLLEWQRNQDEHGGTMTHPDECYRFHAEDY